MTPKALPENQILFINSGLIHPPRRGRQHVKTLMEQMSGVRLYTASTMEVLAQQLPQAFDALVLYFHDKDISREAVEAFDDFVQDGGGVLAIHSATASFKQSQRYLDVLGGRFIGHGPVESITLEPSDGRDEAFAGISDFTIKDELYLHELSVDIEVQFHTMFKGGRAPMVWTRNHGRGRVCYICPGHRSQTIAHPNVQQLLQRGLTWVCG